MNCVSLNNNLDDKIEEIRSLLQYKKEYKQCIIKCKQLYTQLKDSDKQFYFWACVYDTALAYRKLKDIRNSMIFTYKSMLFDVEDNYRTKSIWLMGCNYQSMNKLDSAVKCFKQCSTYYKNVGLKRLRIEVLFNIGEIVDKPLSLIRLITAMLNDEGYSYKGLTQIEVGKYPLILGECQEFAEWAIIHNHKQCIWQLLNSIYDKGLKKEVRNLFISLKCL